MIVNIEKRLQDPSRIVIFPADEALVLVFPIMIGMMARQILIGAVVAFLMFTAWKRLKGEGGVELLLAAMYWYLPTELGFYKPFPDSAIEVWQS